MDIIKLSLPERTKGFTHVYKLTFADLTTAGTAQTINLGGALANGNLVDNAAWYVKTQFSGGSATALTVQVGYTGTTNGLITAQSVLSGATPILTSPGNGAGLNQAGGVGFAAASQLVAVFTSTTANVNTLTAGEIWIYVSLHDLAQAQ